MTNLIGAPRVPTDPAQRPSITGTVRYTRSYAGGAVAGLGTGEYPIRYDWPASGDLLAGTWLLDTGTPPLSPIPLAAARFEQSDPAPEGVLIIAGTLRYPSGAAQAFEVRRLPVETSAGVLDLRAEIDPPAWTTPQQLADLIGDVQAAGEAAQAAAGQVTAALTGVQAAVAPIAPALAGLMSMTEELRSVAATRSLGRAPQAGDPAGVYRWVDGDGNVLDTAWDGAATTGQTLALTTTIMLDRLTANTLTDLRALPPSAARHVVVHGYMAPGDWGDSRVARWEAGESATIPGMIERPDGTAPGTAGRWVFGTDILGRIRSSWLGLDRSGGAESSGALNAALSRYDVLLEHGKYRNDLGLTIPRGRRLIGTSSGPGTCVIDSSRMGGSLTCAEIPFSTDPYTGGRSDHWFAEPLSGVELVGPGQQSGSGLADGTWAAADGLNVAGSMIVFDNVMIRGFRRNLVLTPNNTYNVKFRRCVISGGQFGVSALSVAAGHNSGELISFSECFVSGNQTGWNIDDGWEIVAHRTSTDYNYQQIGGARTADGRGMSLSIIGGHVEWDSEQPAVHLDGNGGPDVRLIGSTFGRIFYERNPDGTKVLGGDGKPIQHTTIDVTREHIYGIIAISGKGGQRGSLVIRDADLLHNGMTDLAYSAKAIDNTLFEGANYYNDTGTALEITLTVEFAPDNGTGGTLSVWCQALSLDNGSGGVPAGAVKIVDELVPIGVPAGMKRTVTFRVPNMWHYRVETNNYAAVQNVIRRSVPSA